MKSKITPWSILLTSAITTATHAIAPNVEKLTLTTTVGDEVTIRVHTNPGSTGTGWFQLIDQPTKTAPLKLVKIRDIRMRHDPSLVGAGFDQEWTFEAKKPGTHTVTLINKHMWADPEIYGIIEATVTVLETGAQKK